MLRRVALVINNVSVELSARLTPMMEALSSCETLVLTRATLRNNPEDTFLHSHRSENLKSYKIILLYIFIFCLFKQ
jgi:hypothetical protein